MIEPWLCERGRSPTKGHEQVYQNLCAALTATETPFPGTDLRLIYECICSV